jgi:hypothetical protein
VERRKQYELMHELAVAELMKKYRNLTLDSLDSLGRIGFITRVANKYMGFSYKIMREEMKCLDA